MDLIKAREKIETAIDQNGPYSHNICGLVLSSVVQDHGFETANELIEEYGLEFLYSIRPIEGRD